MIEPHAKVLSNFLLIRRRRCAGLAVGLFGHGFLRRSRGRFDPAEGLKKWMAKHADWYFAYTDAGAKSLEMIGFPPRRITAFRNTIDTRSRRTYYEKITPDDRRETLKGLGIPDSARVALFVGALYPAKEPVFLINAAVEIRKSLPDFHLIVVGDGPLMGQVKDAAGEHRWIHFTGAKFGDAVAAYGSVSEVFLLPGAVGLNILDAFAFGLPLVTTARDDHGPEIDYLNDHENGLMVRAGSAAEFANEVVELMSDIPLLTKLQAASRSDADSYSLEATVTRVRIGVLTALDADLVKRPSSVCRAVDAVLRHMPEHKGK